MFHLKDEQSPKRPLSTFSGLVFHHTVVLLLLVNCCKGQLQVIGPRLPIVAVAGGDVMLPCHIKPAMDAASTAVEWTRPDLKPRFVHKWRSGQELLDDQHPSYKGRTSLFIDKLKLGDISLKLSRVQLSDKGTYRCFIPTLNIDSTVELVFGSASSPDIMISKVSRGVVMDCGSRGWYPEPEVLWLDGEGKLLSAGPTETVRGPDDLYTVSSRVTVEKRHSNSFTCRVHQRTTNQTRETHITVPDDFFVAPCGSAACISISLVACFSCVLAVVFSVWRWRRNTIKTETTTASQRETQQLLAESQQKEREHEDMVGVLKEQKEELNQQRDQLNEQQQKMESLVTDTEMKLQSVEKDLTTGKLKEIIGLYKWGVKDRRRELQQLVLNTERLLERTERVIVRTTDGKNTEPHDEEEKS